MVRGSLRKPPGGNQAVLKCEDSPYAEVSIGRIGMCDRHILPDESLQSSLFLGHPRWDRVAEEIKLIFSPNDSIPLERRRGVLRNPNSECLPGPGVRILCPNLLYVRIQGLLSQPVQMFITVKVRTEWSPLGKEDSWQVKKNVYRIWILFPFSLKHTTVWLCVLQPMVVFADLGLHRQRCFFKYLVAVRKRDWRGERKWPSLGWHLGCD